MPLFRLVRYCLVYLYTWILGVPGNWFNNDNMDIYLTGIGKLANHSKLKLSTMSIAKYTHIIVFYINYPFNYRCLISIFSEPAMHDEIVILKVCFISLTSKTIIWSWTIQYSAVIIQTLRPRLVLLILLLFSCHIFYINFKHQLFSILF